MTKFQQLYDEASTPEQKELLIKQGVRKLLNDEKKEQWAKVLKNEYGISKTVTKEISINSYTKYYKILAVAASLILLVFVGQRMYDTIEGPEELAMSYLEESSIKHPGVNKGLADTGQRFRQAAIKAFDSGDYELSINQFNLIPEPTSEDQFYLGVALLNTQEYKQAIEVFNLLEQEESIYNQEINWYKSLALMLTGDLASAKASLSRIGTNDWN